MKERDRNESKIKQERKGMRERKKALQRGEQRNGDRKSESERER